jgi:hypothetical protein
LAFSIADMQNAIRTGVRAIAGVPTGAVVWSDEQRPAANVLVVLTIVQLGSDHDRQEYVGDPDNDGQLLLEISTLQYMRVQVRAESIFNGPGHDALFVAERIRAALRRVDLVWGPAGEVTNQPDVNTYLHHVPFPHDGRLISGWSFETNFHAVTDYMLPSDGGPIAGGPNMQQVEVGGPEADPPATTQVVDRPT